MSFDLNGSHVFDASQQEIWDAMNDPDVLEACLPAVAYIDHHAIDHFEVKFEKRFGFIPIRASVNIHILDATGADSNCPTSWRIEASGTHKLIGMAKAGADIKMQPSASEDQTILHYEAFASLGEALLKLLGSTYETRVNGWIDSFFDKFQVEIEKRRVA